MRILWVIVATLMSVPDVRAGQVSPPPSPASPPVPARSSAHIGPVRLQVRNTTRVEAWQFFEPHPGGGDPEYAFVANRLTLGFDFSHRHLDASAALQYVQFGGLPVRATGPGPLGTGPQYFDHAGRTDSRHVYVRTLQARLKDIVPGVTIQAGRFGYASGAESPSGDPKIESVKRQRLDSRLIGEFEWSLYQRSFDGARVDVDQPAWRGTASWFRPTQGGFEEHAGRGLRNVGIAAVTVNLKPRAVLRRTDVQGFAYRYDDTRRVAARPDNSLAPATSVDVHVTSLGTSLVGAYPVGRGQLDALAWLVWQGGRWYAQEHAATAVAAELGYQWTETRGRPWLRGGWFRSSGDSDPADNRHTTFFQMLPTTRRYSLSTVYNLMNLSETFGQILVRPRANLSLRLDVRRLRLTTAADLWYAGSGATTDAGTTFGFAGRRSNGSASLGRMIEGVADWAVSSHVSLNGYLGEMHGGDVVGKTFAGTRLRFGYLETVVSF